MGVSLHACTLLVVAVSPALVLGAETTRPYVVVYDTPPGSPFPVQAETAARERAYGVPERAAASATRSTASPRV